MTDWLAEVCARLAIALVGIRTMAIEVERCQAANGAREAFAFVLIDRREDEVKAEPANTGAPSTVMGFREGNRP